MPKPKKMRIGIYAPDQLAQVLSIMERPNGDLIVLPSSPPQSSPYSRTAGEDMGDSTFDQSEFPNRIELRFSVHVSPESPGHTIVRHSRTDDGSYIRQYSYYVPSDSDNFFPLYAVRAPRLCKPEHLMKTKSGDTSSTIGTYDPDNCALIYAVFVSAPKARPVFKTRFHIYSFDFIAFSVHICWGFAYGTTGWKSITVTRASALREEGGHGRDERLSDGEASLAAEKLDEWLTRSLHLVTVHHTTVVLQYLESKGLTLPSDVLRAFGHLYRDPLLKNPKPDQN